MTTIPEILTKPVPIPRLAKPALAIVLFVFAVWFVYSFLPVDVEWYPEISERWIGVDWKRAFRPASLDALAGRYPYDGGVFNPPWVFWMLLPLALLPPNLGTAVVFVLGIAAYGYLAHRLGASPITALALALSPPVLHGAIQANIDSFVLLGLIMPPQIGLFFILAKPQMGLPVAVFWLIGAWREGGYKQVAKVFAPVTIATSLSFVLYGPWPLEALNVVDKSWNVSLWPYGIPFGIALLWLAVHRRSLGTSALSAALLTPYIAPSSLSVVALGLLPSRILPLIAVIAMWLLWYVAGWGWFVIFTLLPF